jgi:hypothetical protein
MVWYRRLDTRGNRPDPDTKIVVVGDVLDHVPADTPWVSEVERRTQLAARRLYVASRFLR